MRRIAAAALSLLAVAGLAACGGADSPAEQAWSVAPLATPAAAASAQANLAVTAGGEPVLSWLEPGDGNRHALKYAVFDGSGWGPPRAVASGENWFVNWADVPSVVPVDGTTWVAHWLVLKPDERYAYDIAYAVSSDGGRSWAAPRILNEDAGIAEHGFVSFFPWERDIGAIWLDGRQIAAVSIDEFLASETVIGMALRYARIDSSGAVRAFGEVDELACDCCQTDAAATSGGPIVIYRDRTQDERRDIVVRRVAASTFAPPVEIGGEGWIIDGCPVNGPAIAADGASVAAAWFTAADDRPRVRFARSADGGMTFGPAVDVATAGAFGQVDVVQLDDSRAVVSWWERSAEGGMNLVARPIGVANELGEQRVIGHSPESLPVDVPQMQRHGSTLVFAWSQLDEPAGIHTVAAPVW